MPLAGPGGASGRNPLSPTLLTPQNEGISTYTD
jgi:hypothetical protein